MPNKIIYPLMVVIILFCSCKNDSDQNTDMTKRALNNEIQNSEDLNQKSNYWPSLIENTDITSKDRKLIVRVNKKYNQKKRAAKKEKTWSKAFRKQLNLDKKSELINGLGKKKYKQLQSFNRKWE